MKLKNLFIGPHPDDIFISCAGYILKNINQIQADIVCVATENINPSKEIRKKEECNAWKELLKNNYNLFFLDNFEDTKIFEKSNLLIQDIENIINKNQYDKIFIPFIKDTHQDHRAVAECSISALRYQKNIIFYETPSSIDFNAKIYVDIPKDIFDKKCLAIKNYNSQILGRNSNSEIKLTDYVHSKMISDGLKSRICSYAEGFIPFKYFF